MFIGKLFPIALLIIANSTLAFKLVNPASYHQITSQSPKVEQPSVDIRKTSDGQLIAVVKDHVGFPNTIFALQTTEVVSITSPIILNNVDVIYLNDCVTFRSKSNGQNVVFKLTSSTCPIPTSGNIGTFRGFGVIKQQRQSVYNILVAYGGPIFPPSTELVVCDCVPNDTPDGGNCKGGGSGASECSYTESVSGGTVGISAACSVKCDAGHYACCYDN
ncbi:MAG: hypothetical protein ACKVU0_14645 [Saprospiraceae bacterium]